MRSGLKPTFSVLVIALSIVIAGCNSTQAPPLDASNGDPNGNLAPVDQTQPAQPAASYPSSYPSSASAPASAPAPQYDTPPSGDNSASYDPGTDLVEAQQPPPPLPDYSQPPSPGDDYMWTPGYWSYSDAGY